MSNNEAIRLIRKLSMMCEFTDAYGDPIDSDTYYEAVDMAISALEKQIPKKPTVPVDTWLCPSCGESVEYQQKLGDNVLYHGQHDFCPKCGQAIEWEENEE